jgi:hypothetical protein
MPYGTIRPVISISVAFQRDGFCFFLLPLSSEDFRFPYGQPTAFADFIGLNKFDIVRYEWVRYFHYAEGILKR